MPISLADSLRTMIAARDSLIHDMATRSIAINVPPQNISVATSRDVVDYFVNPGVAVLAALIGAIVGGWMTQRASLVAQREALSSSRSDDKERLKHVADVLLAKVIATSTVIAQSPPDVSINLALLVDLDATLARYELVGDRVHLLRDPTFVADLEVLLGRVKTGLVFARTEEAEMDYEFKRLNLPLFGDSYALGVLRQQCRARRQFLIGEIGAWAEPAGRLRTSLKSQ